MTFSNTSPRYLLFDFCFSSVYSTMWNVHWERLITIGRLSIESESNCDEEFTKSTHKTRILFELWSNQFTHIPIWSIFKFIWVIHQSAWVICLRAVKSLPQALENNLILKNISHERIKYSDQMLDYLIWCFFLFSLSWCWFNRHDHRTGGHRDNALRCHTN